MLEAQRVDNQSRIEVEQQTVLQMNERVPPRNVVNDSINATLSGFEPLTYSKERSNFLRPSGLEPKNTLAHTSNNESSPEANTGCNKRSYRNPTILSPINQNSIDSRSIIPPWLYEEEDNDDYDADHEEDIVRSKLRTIESICLRGGGTVTVETVTEEETKKGIEEVEPPPSQPLNNSHIPTTTKKIQPSIQTEYDPMKDDPPPAIITPLYEPLWKKNEHRGDRWDPAVLHAEQDFIQIYGQNNNGISDITVLKYDDTFKHMKEVNADIFCKQ